MSLTLLAAYAEQIVDQIPFDALFLSLEMCHPLPAAADNRDRSHRRRKPNDQTVDT